MMIASMPVLNNPVLAQSSSQVIQNAQKIYDEIIDANHGIRSYASAVYAAIYDDFQIVNKGSEFVMYYNLGIDMGSAYLNAAISFLTLQPNKALKDVGELAFDTMVDQMTPEVMRFSLEDFIYSQAYEGFSRNSFIDLLKVGIKIERDYNGKIPNEIIAIEFICAYKRVEMDRASVQMGKDYFNAKFYYSQWDITMELLGKTISDLVTSYIGDKIGSRTEFLYKYVYGKTTVTFYEFINSVASKANNEHVTKWKDDVIRITKEMEKLITLDVDDLQQSAQQPYVYNGPIYVAQVADEDNIWFKGGYSYSGANGNGKSIRENAPGWVTITLKATDMSAPFPYHVIHQDGSSIVYGWVGAEALDFNKHGNAAPTNPTISISKNAISTGEDVTFDFSATNSPTFAIGINKDNIRIDTKDCKTSYTRSFSEPGSYSAYVTAWNSAGGKDSAKISFEVVNKPGKPMFSVTASFGGDIDLAWGAVSNADNYDLRIFDYNTHELKKTYWAIVGTNCKVTLPSGSYYATLCAVNMTTKAWTSSDHLNFDVDATKEYIITFNANGGNTPIPNIRLNNAITYGALPKPTFKGYSFIGWYTELNGGTVITAETSMLSKAYQTLYAHWTHLPSGLDNFGQVNDYKDGQFSDVSSDKWYSSNVATAYNLGLMVGSSRTAFNLLGNVTIAEAITMASRLHCIFYSGFENFTQDGGIWYNIYVTYAANNGITTKIYDSYTRAATRAEFADIFANALPPEALLKINTVDNNAIPGVSVSESYAQSVYLLYRAGIIVGSDNAGTFNAMSSINRAEAAAIVTRMADISMRQSVTLPTTISTPIPTPTPPPETPKANISDGIYYIVNKANGRFMNAYSDAEALAPSSVVAAVSDGTSEQMFRIEKQTDGSYIFYCQNYGGAKKLSVAYDFSIGRQFYITDTNYPSAQRFILYVQDNGTYTISPTDAINANIVIGIANSGPYSAPYIQISNNTGTSEQWDIQAVSVLDSQPRLPIDKNLGRWYGLTYPGHYKSDQYPYQYPYQYSAIDLNLTGNADAGQNVYAVQEGTVDYISSDGGFLAIKHTSPLVLRNTYSYSTWYSIYGHMSDVAVSTGMSVKKGDIIGKVGMVSTTTEHLHFVLCTSYNSTGTTISNAISPYWLQGDYYNYDLYADDLYGTREPAGLYEELIFRAMP